MVLERTSCKSSALRNQFCVLGQRSLTPVELSPRVKHLSADSDALLINAQQELEKLYVILGNTSTDDKQESEK